ncbi:MAG: bacillithiol biosynthesis BshC, partial [Bacteroidia bacterium]|nr:bacillithiol biosynthesis BshC [Bacteroidia bacterium]
MLIKCIYNELLKIAYKPGNTMAQATQYLLYHFFHAYGLVVLDANTKILKEQFVPILKDELINLSAKKQVDLVLQDFAKSYDEPVKPRDINLFYLQQGTRDRLEFENGKYLIKNSTIAFDKAAVLKEAETFPERFSPNVILRPLYQCTILPDVAFVGGGAEVAYWMVLKKLFAHHQVSMPLIVLRDSALWIDSNMAKKMDRLQLETIDLFQPMEALLKEWLIRHSETSPDFEPEKQELESILRRIKTKMESLDKGLKPEVEVTSVEIKKQLEQLEKKLLRSLKRKNEESLLQIDNLKQKLFPKQ